MVAARTVTGRVRSAKGIPPLVELPIQSESDLTWFDGLTW
jgi:hypothetical protein